MEVVLQWLDEIEDSIFVTVALAHRWRAELLDIGFCAALALPLMRSDVELSPYGAVCAGIALASVLAWCTALGVTRATELRRRAQLTP